MPSEPAPPNSLERHASDPIDPIESVTHPQDVAAVRAALSGAAGFRESLGQRLARAGAMLSSINQRHGSPLDVTELSDVAQDVAATAWRRLESYEGRAALETWLFRIATFEFLNAARKKQREKARTDPDGLDTNSAMRSSGSGSALQDFARLYRVLDRLDSTSQAVIDLKHYQLKTFESIASALEISPSAVKRIYYGALQRLKQLLKDSDPQ